MMKLPSDFKPVDERPGWHRSPTGDYLVLEARALKLHEKFPPPIQIVCGLLEGDTGHSLHLLEEASPIEIAREFETGSHRGDPSATELVCEELSRVFKIAPFRPYFVDAAGFKAKFIDRITKKQAKAIGEILTVGQEGYEPEVLDGEWGIAAVLLKENGLRLWWD